MTIIKLGIVTAILLFGLILYAVCVPSPTIAGECTSYDATLAAIQAKGYAPFIIPTERLDKVAVDAEAITGEHYEHPTRGFLVVGEVETVLGLEIGGCLLDPIRMATPKPATGA